MTTITLPPEIEGPLGEAARRQGTTPEQLALESLRKLFVPTPGDGEPTVGASLFDFLAGHIGTVAGSSEALSENCGS
jgi:hypothetical protein